MIQEPAWIRLAVAVLLGSVVGLERELSGQRAGLRTHALVALGAALFIVVTLRFFQPPLSPPLPPGDALRTVAALVTGVGFLGAGTIVRSRGAVQGLTTAASIWATAATGLAVGAGQYQLAAVSVALVLLVLRGLEWLKEATGLTRKRRR